MSANYYGLPQDAWNELVVRAEDLLRDQQLGTHLVGAYPAGYRMYGLQDEPPGILCLYVDSVDSLINPLSSRNTLQKASFDLFAFHGVGEVYMVDIFDWIRLAVERCPDVPEWARSRLIHLAPFGDIIHEDSSITSIVSEAKSARSIVSVSLTKQYTHIDWLLNRTETIFALHSYFSPCINPDWRAVTNLDDICPSDNAIRNAILCGNQPSQSSIQQAVSNMEWACKHRKFAAGVYPK